MKGHSPAGLRLPSSRDNRSDDVGSGGEDPGGQLRVLAATEVVGLPSRMRNSMILDKGHVISPLAAYGGGHSPSSPQRGQQAGLCVAGVRQLDLVTERAAGMQELGLRGDDVEAGVH
jgi:hypothetical protein